MLAESIETIKSIKTNVEKTNKIRSKNLIIKNYEKFIINSFIKCISDKYFFYYPI
jgi:hypothetical protein